VKVRRDEGVANRIGPEPCVGIREHGDEVSGGERTGQLWSRESLKVSGADVVGLMKATWTGALLRAPAQPGVVKDTGMCGSSLHGNRTSFQWSWANLAGRQHRQRATVD